MSPMIRAIVTDIEGTTSSLSAASVPESGPARVRTEFIARGRRLRRGFAVAAVVLAVVGMGWEGHSRCEKVSQVAWMDVLNVGAVPAAGTRGLGDGSLMTWEVSEKPPREPKAQAIAERMPDEPLEGQKHAPCKGVGEIEINRACWRQLADVPPLCDDAYEWKHGCYYPVMEKKGRPRTLSTRDSPPLQAERRCAPWFEPSSRTSRAPPQACPS